MFNPSFVQLQYLNMENCGIDDNDLTYIAKVDTINMLVLNNNEVTDTTCLRDLNKLEFLSISNNDITSLGFLDSLDKIYYLDVSYNTNIDLTDMPPFCLSNIVYLDISYCDLTSLGPIIGNSNIGSGTIMYINGNTISAEEITILEDRGVILYYD